MMSATIARQNYLNTTAAKTAEIFQVVANRVEMILEKIEKEINCASHEGRELLYLYFPVENITSNPRGLNTTTCFEHCAYHASNKSYWISLFKTIRMDYTNVNIPVEDQRDMYLNVLRDAGYEISKMTDGSWRVKWA